MFGSERQLGEAVNLTKNQKLVLDALLAREEPLGAYTLLERLRDHGIRSPLQVYRALDRLVEAGLVHRLESINAFVACAHPHDHKHGLIAFAICQNCGQVDEFADDVVEERLHGWTCEHAFRPVKTTIEMRGVCGACQAA